MENKLVTYSINGKEAQGYLVVPENSKGARLAEAGEVPRKRGVVVIQEWWGLNDNIKDVARRVAELGYITIAPDLYDGKVAKEPDEAQKLRMEMQLPEAVKKIESAAKFLKTEQGVEKVAVMGFCMGGTLTLLAATTGQFAAAAPFYGRIVDEIKKDWDKINIPILGLYGTLDHGIPVETVNELKSVLDKNGVVNEFHFYDAGHAFFNDTRESFDEKSSKNAWKKVKVWFKKYL